MRKVRFSGAAAGLVGVVALLAPASPAVAAEPASAPGAITWQPCEEDRSADCGTMRVPVDWSAPSGPTVEIAVARRKATDPKRRLGALLINPGGPGGSGVGFALAAREAFSPELNAHFDIVGFDPRGVARSHEVTCDSDLLARKPTEPPASPGEFYRAMANNAALGDDCRRRTGPLFDHVDTASVVRDMDAIRAALGEKQISYYGVSYGTQIGQQYAELFPRRVRAMVIDSNIDHSIRSTYRYLATETVAFEGSFVEFAKWCRRTDGCALYRKDVLRIWDGLYARAEQGKLTDPRSGAAVAPAELAGLAFGSMYDPSAWESLAEELAVLARLAPPAAAERHATRGEPLGNSYQAVLCQDWHLPVRGYRQWADWRTRLAKLAPHTRITSFWSDVTDCNAWPADVTNPQHRLRIPAGVPLLITNSKWDVATPLSWGDAVARQVPHASYLVYDGVGHGDYWLSGCARSAIDAFLIAKTRPKHGKHCPAVWPTIGASSLSPSYPNPVVPQPGVITR